MIDRNDIIEEQLLRENIRKAIAIVKKRRSEGEDHIRTITRALLREAAAAPRYEYNALNELHGLMSRAFGSTDSKKADGKFPFKESFINLVSDPEDREIFVEFILDFSNDTMDQVDIGEDVENIKKSDKEELREPKIDPELESEDDTITVSIGDIPGADLSADTEPELEELQDDFTLGEDPQPEEETNAELKSYSQKAYAKIQTSLQEYYENFKDRIIEDEIVIDTQTNKFLPESERQYKTYPPNTLTERDLFRMFYKINVLSWAGRYNHEYFNENPETNIELSSSDFDGQDTFGL